MLDKTDGEESRYELEELTCGVPQSLGSGADCQLLAVGVALVVPILRSCSTPT